MKTMSRLTRQQGRNALRMAKTVKGRAQLNEMLALQQEAWQRLETLVDQGVTAPHVLKEREDVSHNLRVLQTALGSFQA